MKGDENVEDMFSDKKFNELFSKEREKEIENVKEVRNAYASFVETIDEIIAMMEKEKNGEEVEEKEYLEKISILTKQAIKIKTTSL